MRASMAHTMSISIPTAIIASSVAVGAPTSSFANVITDWDEKAVAVVTPMPPYTAQRVMGMVHAAMFDAVNSIEQRYQRYLVQLPAAPETSKEAAIAASLPPGPYTAVLSGVNNGEGVGIVEVYDRGP